MLFRVLWLTMVCALAALPQTAVDPERFERLMKDILVIDTHIDTPRYVLDEGYNFGIENDYNETDIPRLRRGHVGGVFFGFPSRGPKHLWVQRTLDQIDVTYEMAARYPADLEIAYTADDIRRIHARGKIAILLSIEGGHMIEDSLRLLRNYYRLGVRYITLTHFATNNWADSSTDTAVHNGLSSYGRDIVREMNRLGMMVDISHVSDKTFFDAVEVSRAPVIASHSSVHAFCDTPRNMRDELIRALGANGGVMFINFSAAYLDQEGWRIHSATKADRTREEIDVLALREDDPRRFDLVRAIKKRYARMLPPVSYKAVLRHIDHVVKLVGPDHVGFGSDYDGISGMVPQGLEDVSKYPTLVRGMIEMGYSDEDIRKIAGGNLLRVMKRAEQVAAEIAREAR